MEDRVDAAGPLAPEEHSRLGAAEIAALLGKGVDDGPAVDLMGLHARELSELGRLCRDRDDGRIAGQKEAADGSVETPVGLFAGMPFVPNVGRYDELGVPFRKVVPLAATDRSLAFGDEGWSRFGNIDRLTIFVDNLVPHLHRVDGVLPYGPVPAARSRAGEPTRAARAAGGRDSGW